MDAQISKYPRVSNYAIHHTNKNITDLHQSLATFGYPATASKSLRTKSSDTIIVQQAGSPCTDDVFMRMHLLTPSAFSEHSTAWKLER